MQRIFWNKITAFIFTFIYLKIESRINYLFLKRKIKNNHSYRIKSLNTFKFKKFDFEKVCIFVSYSKKLSLSSKIYIKKLEENSYKVIHLNNLKTSADDIIFLKENNCISFDRLNIGRDIGAYRDGYLFLQKNNYLKSIKYLCYTNDSIQIISGKKLDSFFHSIKEFESKDEKFDVLASHLSFEPIPHYQSFFTILKANIFTRKDYQKFWDKYLPLNDRRHAIQNYEIKFSKKFLNKAKVMVMNEPYSVTKKIIEESRYQKKLYKIIRLINYGKDNRAGDLIINLEDGNPTHVGAFIYPIYGNFPFLKKDLVLAGSYSFGLIRNGYDEILRFSEENKCISQELISEFGEMLIKKGTIASLKTTPFKAYRLGVMPGNLF